MIPLFPQPFKDELLYSVIARYHIMNRNPNFSTTYKELFGVNYKTVSNIMPSALVSFYKRLNPFRPFGSIKELICEHTGFNYYTFFLNKELEDTILKVLKASKASNINLSLGIAASRIKAFRYLRFCPSCVNMDFEDYGYSYWRLHHQLPGVFICSTHSEPTHDSNVLVGTNHLVLPSKELQFKEKVYSNGIKNSLELIAFISKSLLSNKRKFSYNIHRIFRNLLRDLEYGRYKKFIDAKLLCEDFFEYFDIYLFNELGMDPNYIKASLPNNWSYKETKQQPLLQILLFIFVMDKYKIAIDDNNLFKLIEHGNSIEDTVIAERENVKQSCVCLNKYCSDYRLNNFSNVTISYKKAIIIRYKCENCGLIYRKKGIPEKDYTWDYIIECGQLLDRKIHNMFHNDKISTYAISRLTGVSTYSVNKSLDVIKVNKRRYNRKFNKDKDRVEWSNLINSNSELYKYELTKLNYALYKRLYNNDREWLLSQNYNIVKRKKLKGNVNWLKRDEEYLIKMQLAAEELKKELPPRRLNLQSIINQSGLSWQKDKLADKMPLTYNFLCSMDEDRENFRIRKAKYIISEQRKLEMGERLPLKKLRHKVGFYLAKTKEAKEAIGKLLEEIYDIGEYRE